jgi:hypothetical protein
LLLGGNGFFCRLSAAIELKAAGDTPAATTDLASRMPPSTERLGFLSSFVRHSLIHVNRVIRGSSKWLAPKIKKSVDTLQRIP